MYKLVKRTLSLSLACVLSLGLLSGCGKKASNTDKPTGAEPTQTEDKDRGEPTIITFGTHNAKEMDPELKDPVTGEYTMNADRRLGAQKGLDIIKDKYNVEMKFVQYAGPPTEVLLKSVLANDPLCDIGIVAYGRGTVIGQNILQSLDKYADEFKDPEYAWMFPDKVYGHHFLLNWDMEFTRTNCLSYNISYIEKVEALKENGKTVLPVDLWKQGKWTWSTFKDYLTKISTYYANKKAPVRTDVPIVAYGTDVLEPAKAFIKTTGEQIYGEKGIGADSKDTKRAVAFVDELFAKKLITHISTNNAQGRSEAMRDGEVVFTDLPNWVMAKAGAGVASRGEAMGIVPFPRPDDIPADDPRYQQIVDCPGSTGIIKAIGEKKTDLAVKTYKTYFNEVLKGRTGADSIAEFFKSKESGKMEAAAHGYDVTNEAYGSEIVDAYMAYNPNLRANEFQALTNWGDTWIKTVRDSILGTDGSPKYDTAIASQMQSFKEQIDDITSIVGSEKIVDNIAPAIALVGKGIALPKGTDAKTVDWSKYIKITDNVDGDLDVKSATIDTSKIKFDTAAFYDKSLLITAKDKEGNEKKAQMGVVIYDPDNKEAPTLTMKETYRAVKLNEDASKINWGNDFVAAATSKEGFDLKGYVTADISSLDVTAAGTYDVTLTVTDYAGNKTEQKIKVTVAGK